MAATLTAAGRETKRRKTFLGENFGRNSTLANWGGKGALIHSSFAQEHIAPWLGKWEELKVFQNRVGGVGGGGEEQQQLLLVEW